jgi:NAD(P)-dependent dehydrogenase (short-subunit alcohol dehydrogenase family)
MGNLDKGMFDLSGKVALITAGGHGLGRAFCNVLAEYGADVACDDMDFEGAKETVEGLKRFGGRAIATQGDVSKPEDVTRMVSETLDEFGTIDILFSNAATRTPRVRLHELPIEEWNKAMAVNLTGAFLCLRAVIPVMLEKKKGSIIITSSIAGIMGGWEERSPSNMSAYGASKHGVNGLTKHAAVAYARDGIRVNAIAPGAHDTMPVSIPPEMREMRKKEEAWLSKYIPMGRLGRPEEIQGLALYLASDASSYVTGQIFVQDGGFTV